MIGILKRIPKWCWYVFPAAIFLFLFFAFRDGGRVARRWLSPPELPSPRPPAITPKDAEDKREEIREELKAGEEKAESEADALRRRAREKFGEIE